MNFSAYFLLQPRKRYSFHIFTILFTNISEWSFAPVVQYFFIICILSNTNKFDSLFGDEFRFFQRLNCGSLQTQLQRYIAVNRLKTNDISQRYQPQLWRHYFYFHIFVNTKWYSLACNHQVLLRTISHSFHLR